MFTEFTDIVPSFFVWLNQGSMILTLFLHSAIVLPMYFIYKQEKKRLESENKGK